MFNLQKRQLLPKLSLSASNNNLLTLDLDVSLASKGGDNRAKDGGRLEHDAKNTELHNEKRRLRSEQNQLF